MFREYRHAKTTIIVFGLTLSVVAFAWGEIRGAAIPRRAEGAAETQGSLRAVKPDGESLGTCPLLHTGVKAEITGMLSRVTVRQDFRNAFQDPIEAVYSFPLPHDAAVDEMNIRIGDRTIRGVVKRREEARATYEQARAQGRQAALLDQERPNIFTQSIANILPGQNVQVTIRYVETLPYRNGEVRFVFPMVVGPRYVPGTPMGKEGPGWSPDTTQVPDASRITPPVAPKNTRAGHDISIEVDLDSGVPFSNLRALQHPITVIPREPGSAIVRLADQAEIPNRDFILTYQVAGPDLREGLATHRTAEDGYFMLILQPPQKIAAQQIVPKELVFVLDTSGSMQGFPIEKAKETMELALVGLHPRDTFNLITFSGSTRILFPQPVPASPENLAEALNLLTSTRGSGGTEMMAAIRAALAPSDAQDHVRVVCFMTDGFVGNDLQILSEIQKHPNARVFSFGIGSAPNRFLLDRMAEEGRGAAEYVTPEDDAAAAARRFDERIRDPLLTDISLEWSGAPVTDVYPARVPDLFGAEPVILCGRYTKGGVAHLRLRGKTAAGDFLRDLEVPLPELESRHEVLASLWARRRIAALMAQDYQGMQRGNPSGDVKEAITALGLQFGLMTQFTSFVAVEDRVVTEGGKSRTVTVPVEMPAGVSYEGVFGAGGVVGGIPGGVAGGVFSTRMSHAVMVPSPEADRKQPLRVGGNVSGGNLIRRVEPVPPEIIRSARLSGIVEMELQVDAQGNVTDVRVLRGHPLMRDAAVEAVKQWKYRPTLVNGSPVPIVTTAIVRFRFGAPSRLDPAVAEVIARVRKGEAAGVPETKVGSDGKALIRITLSKDDADVRNRLRKLGFEVISWSARSLTASGRMEAAKLESLLELDAVTYVEFAVR